MRLGLVMLALWTCTSLLRADEHKGDFLQVQSLSGNAEILLTSAEGEAVNLTKNPAADLFPAWSPDGQRIAFSSNRETGVFNVYVMNADGSDVQKVTELARGSKANAYCPTWSPDGETLAYQRREGNKSELISIELESGRTRHLADNAWDPAWSPEGDKIAFTGLGEKGWNVFTIEPDGAKRTEIVTNEGPAGFVYPTWSPDGKRVAFTRPTAGAYEVWLCDREGDNLSQLTKSGRMNTHAAWSADGKHLYCLHDLDGKLWRWDAVEVATSKTEPFATLTPAPYAHGGRIAWRPTK